MRVRPVAYQTYLTHVSRIRHAPHVQGPMQQGAASAALLLCNANVLSPALLSPAFLPGAPVPGARAMEHRRRKRREGQGPRKKKGRRGHLPPAKRGADSESLCSGACGQRCATSARTSLQTSMHACMRLHALKKICGKHIICRLRACTLAKGARRMQSGGELARKRR
jgi:hypothetical protein